MTSIGTSGTESFSLLFTINGTVQDEDKIYLQIGGLKNPTNSTSTPGYKVKATAVSGSLGENLLHQDQLFLKRHLQPIM